MLLRFYSLLIWVLVRLMVLVRLFCLRGLYYVGIKFRMN